VYACIVSVSLYQRLCLGESSVNAVVQQAEYHERISLRLCKAMVDNLHEVSQSRSTRFTNISPASAPSNDSLHYDNPDTLSWSVDRPLQFVSKVIECVLT
jgi:hypothetical protein